MAHGNVKDVLLNADISVNEQDPDTLSLESLVFLIKTEKLKHLESQSVNEFTEIRKRQALVAEAYGIIKAINEATDAKGNLDFTNNDDLKTKIVRAKEIGAEVNENKFTYTKEERERLLENLRMTVDELNVENDMQLQKATRIQNERDEIFQFAKTLLRPLDDAKQSHARAMRGA